MYELHRYFKNRSRIKKHIIIDSKRQKERYALEMAVECHATRLSRYLNIVNY